MEGEIIELLERRPAETLVEIGTYKGRTLFLFMRVAASNALLISIDKSSSRVGGRYAPWQARLYRAFAHAVQEFELLQADPHDQTTVKAVRRLLSTSVVLLSVERKKIKAQPNRKVWMSLAKGRRFTPSRFVPPSCPTGGIAGGFQNVNDLERAILEATRAAGRQLCLDAFYPA